MHRGCASYQFGDLSKRPWSPLQLRLFFLHRPDVLREKRCQEWFVKLLNTQSSWHFYCRGLVGAWRYNRVNPSPAIRFSRSLSRYLLVGLQPLATGAPQSYDWELPYPAQFYSLMMLRPCCTVFFRSVNAQYCVMLKFSLRITIKEINHE